MYFNSTKDFNPEEFKLGNNSKLLILIAEGTPSSELTNLFLVLDKLEIDYMGGFFPSVIYKRNYYNSGFIIKKLDNVKFHGVFPLGLENVEVPICNDEEICSLVILDALSSNIKGFLNLLFTNYTDTIKYFGGGAGFIQPKGLLPIFHNGKFYKDSALVLLMETQAELIIRHGFEKMEGPFLVTDSKENILNEINWKNALEFYEEIIFDKTGNKLSQDNFLDTTKGFPFGIETEDGNIIVRDTWSIVDGNKILCVSDIPNNSTIYILKGDTLSLLESSNSIQVQNSKGNSLLFDCVSRAMFLDSNFSTELDNISNKTNNEIIGVLSIGEVATNIKGRLEFLNKTLVYCEFN